jgi:tetratricopeptide (TPR) repeat protein
VARCRYHASILALLIGFGAGCVEAPRSQASWAAKRAEVQLQRALASEAEGDLLRAHELAGVALDESREAVHPPTTARAMALLGRLEGDHLLLLKAINLLDALGETAALIRARLDLAELAVASGQFRMAAAQTDAALTLLEAAELGRQEDARLAARAWHTYAEALREAGAPGAARSRQRQASLMLSLLDDSELPQLRLAVSQRLGDDHAAASDYRQAFQQHSRASFLARDQGNRLAEMIAVTSLSLDLGAMDRPRDAVDHCERALAIALELNEQEHAAVLAQRALQFLVILGETPGSERWALFSTVLKQS